MAYPAAGNLHGGPHKTTERDNHFDNETTNGLGVHVVAHVLQRTPRHLRTPTSTQRIEDKAGARDSARVHCPDSQALTATTYTERRHMPSTMIHPP